MNDNKPFEHEIDPDLLAEIEEWEKTDHDEPAEYYFSNPDPYLKPQPLPPDHPRHNCYFNEDGHLCVKNLSAFWLPEFTLQPSPRSFTARFTPSRAAMREQRALSAS